MERVHSTSGIPILFEALPSRADHSERQRAAHVASLEPLQDLGLAGVNVPEIVNGHYHTVEPRQFALEVQERIGVPAILNRITVHHDATAHRQWAAATRAAGIEHIVYVGGESSAVSYPGVGVVDALQATRDVFESQGVITIPTRRSLSFDEPTRLERKRAAGASFAISQILMESQAASSLQSDVADTALPIYWSLAPVCQEKDLAFLRWLGVDIPRDVARWLSDAAGPKARARRSHEMNLAIARNLLEDAEATGGAATGFCIEHVMAGNIEAAVELVTSVRDLCQEFGALRLARAR